SFPLDRHPWPPPFPYTTLFRSHYDGQAMWDPLLAPSCWHGVTTALFGNCGVGFAPVKPEHRAALMDLMEGVEEIPGVVLADGLKDRKSTRLDSSHLGSSDAVFG